MLETPADEWALVKPKASNPQEICLKSLSLAGVAIFSIKIIHNPQNKSVKKHIDMLNEIPMLLEASSKFSFIMNARG